ncbi:MAG TPA: hypothetical protein VJQ56_09645 [Blastocatellia bacterium]|nr:hypothetical protein [Blastocatellia bacterium]
METVQFIGGEFERVNENLPEVPKITPEKKPFEFPDFIRTHSRGRSIRNIRGRLAARLANSNLPELINYPSTKIDL